MGNEFIQDLESLWMVGKKYIPQISAEYNYTNRYLVDLHVTAKSAFMTGLGASAAFQCWDQVRSELEAMMGRTAVNLDQCGEVVFMVIDSFLSEDAGLAERLEGELMDNDGPVRRLFQSTPKDERYEYHVNVEGRLPTIPKSSIVD